MGLKSSVMKRLFELSLFIFNSLDMQTFKSSKETTTITYCFSILTFSTHNNISEKLKCGYNRFPLEMPFGKSLGKFLKNLLWIHPTMNRRCKGIETGSARVYNSQPNHSL